MYIYILLVTVLAMDVNKYSVTTASCQQRWWTNCIQLHLFLGVEQRTVGCLWLPITTKQQSVVWPVSQSWHMSAILFHSCQWLHLRWQIEVPLWYTQCLKNSPTVSGMILTHCLYCTAKMQVDGVGVEWPSWGGTMTATPPHCSSDLQSPRGDMTPLCSVAWSLKIQQNETSQDMAQRSSVNVLAKLKEKNMTMLK